MIIMEKNNALVSIIIPTLNSERTLKECIEHIRTQSYKNVEVIIVDSFSKDNTLKIAKEFNCVIIQTKWKLLGARYLGVKNSKGTYVFMVDSDQILKNNKVIEDAVKLMKSYDMLVLEESSVKTSTFLEKAANADRKLIHKLYKIQIDPVYGVLLPRFFNKKVITEALRNINMKKFHDVVIFDHVILYYEAYKISNKVGVLNNAILHSEPDNFKEFFKHNYNYGVTARKLKNTEYSELIKAKTRFRTGSFKVKNLSLIINSFILVALKGVAYELGYIFG